MERQSVAPVLLSLRRALGDPEHMEPVCQVLDGPDLALPAVGGGPKMQPMLVRLMAVPYQRAREVVHFVQQGGKRLYILTTAALGKRVSLWHRRGVPVPGIARAREGFRACGGPDKSDHRVAPPECSVQRAVCTYMERAPV
jgi:hypothetical protein